MKRLNSTTIETEGDGAFSRAQSMLEASGIEPETIECVRVELRHWTTNEPPQMGLDTEAGGPDQAPPDSGGPEVETGPTEPVGEGHTKGGGAGGYNGDYTDSNAFEDALKPDSRLGRVVRLLVDDGGWMDRHDIASELGVTPEEASDAVSNLFNERGFVERRRKNPQPNKKGIQREYRASSVGKLALRAGERLARAQDGGGG